MYDEIASRFDGDIFAAVDHDELLLHVYVYMTELFRIGKHDALG